MSKTACPSQHATSSGDLPRVQVVPVSVEYPRKMLLALASFEKATRLFGLVGLTRMKLSDWLPTMTLTFTTGSKQVSGTNNRSIGFTVHALGALCICVFHREHR